MINETSSWETIIERKKSLKNPNIQKKIPPKEFKADVPGLEEPMVFLAPRKERNQNGNKRKN